MKNYTEVFNRLVGSAYFFYATVLLAVGQGLWYALTFWPGQFDEGQHLGLIELYSHRLNPVVFYQPPEWDTLGAVTNNASFVFHYLMSWPLRVMRSFTDSYFVQVLSLRLIMILLFILGLVWLRKAFKKLELDPGFSNLALLLIVSVPGLAVLPGAINYDNAMFLVLGMFTYCSIDLLKSRQPSFTKITTFVVLSILGVLIKPSFLVIAGVTAAFLAYDLLKAHGWGGVWVKLWKSTSNQTLLVKTISVIGIGLALGLFLVRPIANRLRFQDFTPSCVQILNEQRCQKNYTAARNLEFKAAKPSTFIPSTPQKYLTEYWLPGMAGTGARVLPVSMTSPTITWLILISFCMSSLLVLAYTKDLLRNRFYRFFLVIALLYVAVLFRVNYVSYVELGQPVSINGRYLLPILPFLLPIFLIVWDKLFSKKKLLAVILALAVSAVFLTQRGWEPDNLSQHVKDYYWESEPFFNNRIDF